MLFFYTIKLVTLFIDRNWQFSLLIVSKGKNADSKEEIEERQEILLDEVFGEMD